MLKGSWGVAAKAGFYGRRPGHVTKGDRVDRQATSPPPLPPNSGNGDSWVAERAVLLRDLTNMW